MQCNEQSGRECVWESDRERESIMLELAPRVEEETEFAPSPDAFWGTD